MLLDSHDNGSLDAYSRFHDITLPRIKYTPAYEDTKGFNIIATIPIRVRDMYLYNGEEKTIPIIYCGNKRGFTHNIRSVVDERLKPFNPVTARHASMELYAADLKSSKISVACPGAGPIGSAHNESLAAGAVLFSYESVKKVKILPFGELVDGENYVSFNLDNLEDKLSWLLANEDEIKRIGENGRTLFNTGYVPRKTAEIILKYFND